MPTQSWTELATTPAQSRTDLADDASSVHIPSFQGLYWGIVVFEKEILGKSNCKTCVVKQENSPQFVPSFPPRPLSKPEPNDVNDNKFSWLPALV